MNRNLAFSKLCLGIALYDTPVFQTDGVRFSSKEEQAMRA